MLLGKKKFVALALGLALGITPQLGLAAEEVPQSYTQTQLNDEMIMAVAWMQNSAEYRELCYQAYNVALDRVTRAVLHHQKGEKPLAIVLDADETVLDNGAYDAGKIGTDNAHSQTIWNAWCDAAEATAMPGAAEYLQAVDKLGVTIFYVSGRDIEHNLAGTMKNFKAIGFPQADAAHMLFKDKVSNKQERFDKIMQDYDVVVFMGDNAGDLPIGTYHKSQAERNALVDAHKEEFGHRFIALPNPSYGDWEPALKQDGKFGDYWKLSPVEKSEVRRHALHTWRPAEAQAKDSQPSAAQKK